MPKNKRCQSIKEMAEVVVFFLKRHWERRKFSKSLKNDKEDKTSVYPVMIWDKWYIALGITGWL